MRDQTGDVMRLPDFLVIGAPRCGASWLAKALFSHPEVSIPREKLHVILRCPVLVLNQAIYDQLFPG